jgi:hypothetical protein
MVIVASVTSLWSESGSTATPDHLSGIPPSWPGSHCEPSFGRWPTAPLRNDGCNIILTLFLWDFFKDCTN